MGSNITCWIDVRQITESEVSVIVAANLPDGEIKRAVMGSSSEKFGLISVPRGDDVHIVIGGNRSGKFCANSVSTVNTNNNGRGTACESLSGHV